MKLIYLCSVAFILVAITFFGQGCAPPQPNQPSTVKTSVKEHIKLDFNNALDHLQKIGESLEKNDGAQAQELVDVFSGSIDISFPLEIPKTFSTHCLQDMLMKDTKAIKNSGLPKIVESWDELSAKLDGRAVYHGETELLLNTKVARAFLKGIEPRLTTTLLKDFSSFSDAELKEINYISIESFWEKASLYQSDQGVSKEQGTSAVIVKDGGSIVAILEFQNSLIRPKKVDLGSKEDLMEVVPRTPGYVKSVARLAAYARFGIGEKMFEEFFKYARDNGIHESYLRVRADNAAAINLYKKLGYKVVADIPGYYPNPPADANVMLKTF